MSTDATPPATPSPPSPTSTPTSTPSPSTPTEPAPAPAAPPEAFSAQIDEAHRAGVAKFTDANALAQGYLELESKLGSPDRVEMPSDESPKETWDAFYERQGRPAAADGYTVPPIPDGYAFTERPQADLEAFQAVAHEMGLSDRQFMRAVEWWTETNNNYVTSATEGVQNAIIDAEATLKKEWGEAFEQNVTQAEDALTTFDVKSETSPEGEFRKLLADTGLQNDPRMIRFLQHVGRNLAEDIYHRGGHGPQTFIPSPAEAASKIAELSSDEAFSKALFDSHDPGNAAAKKRWRELHATAYPEKPAPAE